MSVVGFAMELPDSPSGHFELNKFSMTRKFRVQTDSFRDGPIIAVNAIGVPRLFSTYLCGNEYNAYARVRNVSAERIDRNSLYWLVTAEYSTPEPYDRKDGASREQAGESDNPLLMIPEVETHFENYQQPLFSIFDDTGKITPCLASNGEVFDPPPIRDAARLALVITRNEDINAPHPATALYYMNTINSDPFWGAQPGQCRCMNVTTQRQTKQLSTGSTLSFLKCAYTFQFKGEGWDLQILDSGTYYIVPPSQLPGSLPKKLMFLSDDGHPIQGALDGKGNKLAKQAVPVFKIYKVYPRLPFSKLGLPQSFPAIA